jgi:hypothetical protein
MNEILVEAKHQIHYIIEVFTPTIIVIGTVYLLMIIRAKIKK